MPLAHIRRGSGPPLVLIHGIGSQWQMWKPVLDRVSREREVVAVDLPGFGESAALPAAPSVEALAASVAGLLEALGLRGVHAAGNSLGGAIALALARAGTARSACVLSPAGFGNMREGAYARAVLAGSWRAAKALDRCADVVVAGPVRRTLAFGHLVARPWRIPAAEAAGALRNLARSPGFAATLDAVREHTFGGRPPDCPVTIAGGEKDRLLLDSRQSARARRLLPDARHVTLDGCGHVPTWDDPEQVARVVLEASAGVRG